MSGPPLRILQVLRAPVGGLFRHVYDLTEELANRGHQVGVVADSLTSDALTGQRLRALAPSIALGTYYFPMPRTVGVGDLTTPFKVRQLARQLNIDVLAALHKRSLPSHLYVAPGLEYRVPTYDMDAFLIEVDLLLEWYVPYRGGLIGIDARAEFAVELFEAALGAEQRFEALQLGGVAGRLQIERTLHQLQRVQGHAHVELGARVEVGQDVVAQMRDGDGEDG